MNEPVNTIMTPMVALRDNKLPHFVIDFCRLDFKPTFEWKIMGEHCFVMILYMNREYRGNDWISTGNEIVWESFQVFWGFIIKILFEMFCTYIVSHRPVWLQFCTCRNRSAAMASAIWLFHYGTYKSNIHFTKIGLSIALTSYWARWPLKSPASELFTQPSIQAQIKENIKASRHWPLCVEFTGDRWIPRSKDQ